ncbi:MAG: DUF3877 family protein [Thermoplasmata archaeon]|nr:DUF3877 family protein [Thermoplasmata archaeon]
MEPRDLEELVVSTIQETQVKLGEAGGAESLYLPLTSISQDEDVDEIRSLLDRFEADARPRLGNVTCDILEGRVRITVPEEGGRYVAGLPVSPVLRLMVDSVMSGASIDDLKRSLKERFPGHVWRDVDGDGFEHIVFFEDGTDPSVYCVGTECCRLVYHRFSRPDYEAFGFGPLRRSFWTP